MAILDPIKFFLSIYYKLYAYFLRLSFNSKSELLLKKSINPPAVLDSLELEFNEVLYKLLRKILRKFPWFTLGHIELGFLALELRDIKTAYYSGLAAKTLEKKTSVKTHWLIGKSLLQLGRPAEAASELEYAQQASPKNLAILDDRVAALMAIQNFEDAESLLKSVSMDKRSVQETALLRYLSNRGEAIKNG